MLWTPKAVEDAGTAIWLANAEDGRFTIPYDCSGNAACVMIEALRRWLDKHEPTPEAGQFPIVRINTGTGDQQNWRVARLVEQIGMRVEIGQFCISAGLNIAISGAVRVCSPQTQFGWHGSTKKPGHDHADDEVRARRMAEHTTQPYEWWMGLALPGELLSFGPAEALAWGVVDEVEGGHV